jgi:hypothetical protein
MGEWGWKKKDPKSGEVQIKTHSGKTYHWCPQHELWLPHKPEDCLLKDEISSDRKKKKVTNKMKMRVYQAAMQETSDEEAQDDTHSDEESSAGDSEST